jgi:hypothetical protein
MLSALALLAATGLIVWYYSPGQPVWLPRCMDSALVALESAATPAEVNEIWRQPGLNKTNIRPNLYADFAFMFAYGLLFVLLGRVASFRGQGWVHLAGIIAMGAACLTVALDASENVFMLRLLPALEHGGELRSADAATVSLTRTVSLGKWAIFGVTMLLLLGAFTPSRAGTALYRILAHVVRMLIAIAGILAIWGFLDNSKIERVVPSLGLALILFTLLVAKYWTVHLTDRNSHINC